jgi:CheY-like chemotaxis protein
VAPDRSAVLLIEDDDGDALLVEDLLSDAAPHVRLIRSRTLHDALGRLPGEIDCVLLDLGLPDVVGLETRQARLRRGPADRGDRAHRPGR